MHLLLVAATQKEIAPTIEWLEKKTDAPVSVSGLRQGLQRLCSGFTPAAVTPVSRIEPATSVVSRYRLPALTLDILITGIGGVATAFALGQYTEQPDRVIQAGIAGAFLPSGLQPGDVVWVKSDRFADLGATNQDGSFLSLHAIGLATDKEPLSNPTPAWFPFEHLPKASALSVNTVSGEAGQIANLLNRYPADVESMEGAAFFYACLQKGWAFDQIRSISNWVEPRNRDAWQLPLAVQQLNDVLLSAINQETYSKE